MTLSLMPVFILNIVVNSLLIFGTACLLTQIILWMLRIRDERLRFCARLIPFLKLGLALFSYQFSQWAFVNGINPLQEPEGSRSLSISIGTNHLYPYIEMFLHLSNHQHFTLGDIFSWAIGLEWTVILACIFMFGSLTAILIHVRTYQCTRHWLQQVQKTAYPTPKAIHHPLLRQRLMNKRTSILVSPLVPVPCAIGFVNPQILIPCDLIKSLSQQQYEAIIAHELEHIRWYDAVSQELVKLICAFFWWIPTSFWRQQLELEQEWACDRQTQQYAISSVTMAETLYLAARYIQHRPLKVISTTFIRHSHFMKRLKALLNYPIHHQSKLSFGCQLSLVAIGLWVILIFKIWTF